MTGLCSVSLTTGEVEFLFKKQQTKHQQTWFANNLYFLMKLVFSEFYIRKFETMQSNEIAYMYV